MASEESPLLAPPSADPEIAKHELLYQRFSPSKKQFIVGLISWAAVIPCQSKFRESTCRNGIDV